MPIATQTQAVRLPLPLLKRQILLKLRLETQVWASRKTTSHLYSTDSTVLTNPGPVRQGEQELVWRWSAKLQNFIRVRSPYRVKSGKRLNSPFDSLRQKMAEVSFCQGDHQQLRAEA